MKYKNLFWPLAAAGCGLIGYPAAAQDYPKEHIFVTGAAHETEHFDILQGSSVLTEEEISRKAEGTIGETLSFEPGINATSFAPGASRPVIRGLGGDRIRVLIGGIGTFDASTTSPDHAVAVEPLSARTIEIIRGPAALLYGSSAAGGVVNIIDGRIPIAVPSEGVTGAAQFLYGTVDDEVSGTAYIDAAFNNIVFHLDGFGRDTGDYDIDGFPTSDARRAIIEAGGGTIEEERGIVTNSDVESYGGSIGASFVGEWGFFGASVNLTEGNYGIPADLEGQEEGAEGGEEEGGVRIDMEQIRFDTMGDIRLDTRLFDRLKLRFGYGDYEHRELEGEETGTIFLNEGWESRIELVQRPVGHIDGSIGLQLRKRDFSAVGAEAFVPPTQTFQWGLFLAQTVDLGIWSFQAGVRYESQESEDLQNDIVRDFEGLNYSGGVAIKPNDDFLFGLNVARTERLPTPEELFSDGPHNATQAFEIGDPSLIEEKAVNIEATVKKRNGRLTGAINIFYTDYDDFIVEIPTGDVEDGLPVFRFIQSQATFYGGEIEARYHAYRGDDRDIHVSGVIDYVRAEQGARDTPVPRIPPFRVLGSIDYEGRHFDGRFELRWADKQDRIADFELPTDAYTQINASMTYRPFPERFDLAIRLQGKNLTDAEIRNHVSFLKDFVPQPGRDIRLSLIGRF